MHLLPYEKNRYSQGKVKKSNIIDLKERNENAIYRSRGASDCKYNLNF